MALVDGDDVCGRIDHDRVLPRAPDEPVVEAGPTDRERRHFAGRGRPGRRSSRERPRRGGGPVRAHRRASRGSSTSRRLADDQEAVGRPATRSAAVSEVVEEHHVRVDEAAQVMARDAVGRCEGGVEARRAVLGAGEVGNVLGAGVGGGVGRAGLVPEEQHLHAAAEGRPARDRAPLDLADPALERLRHGEDRQHALQRSPAAGRARARAPPRGESAQNRHGRVRSCALPFSVPSPPTRPGIGTPLTRKGDRRKGGCKRRSGGRARSGSARRRRRHRPFGHGAPGRRAATRSP